MRIGTFQASKVIILGESSSTSTYHMLLSLKLHKILCESHEITKQFGVGFFSRTLIFLHKTIDH